MPIVETGMFVAVGRDLARRQGQVVGGEDAGDLGDGDAGRGELRRVEGDHDLRSRGRRSGRPSPRRRCPGGAGTISVRATSAAASRPSWLVPATEAMITGEALMLSAVTCGVTFGGQAGGLEVLLDRRAHLLDVGPELELGDDDGDRVGRRRGERARAAGRRRWPARSASSPARRRRPRRRPGTGAMTVMTGKSMSGSSSCLRLPQAEMPAMKSPTASRSVTLRLATESSVRRLTRVLLRWRGTQVGAAAGLGRPRRRGRRGPAR